MPDTRWAKKQYDDIRAWLERNKSHYSLNDDEFFSVEPNKGFFYLRKVSGLNRESIGYFDTEEFLQFINSNTLVAILNLHYKDCDPLTGERIYQGKEYFRKYGEDIWPEKE